MNETATPHVDAALAATNIMRERTAKRRARPGKQGTEDRIIFAMMEAYQMACAVEREAGVEEIDIYKAVLQGLSNVLASTILQIVSKGDTPDPRHAPAAGEGLYLMLGEIGDRAADVMGRSLDGIRPDGTLHHRYEVTEPGRA